MDQYKILYVDHHLCKFSNYCIQFSNQILLYIIIEFNRLIIIYNFLKLILSITFSLFYIDSNRKSIQFTFVADSLNLFF